MDGHRIQEVDILHLGEDTGTVADHPILAQVVDKVLQQFRSLEQANASFLSNTAVQEKVARLEHKGFEHSSVEEAGRDRLRQADIGNRLHAGEGAVSKKNES